MMEIDVSKIIRFSISSPLISCIEVKKKCRLQNCKK